MFLNQIFEFSIALNENKFQEILTMPHVKADEWNEEKEEYIDSTMAEKGIILKFRASQYKKKVLIIYNLQWKQMGKTSKVDKVVSKLDKCIREYFRNKYKLNDFKLSGMIITNDIDVEQPEFVKEYLKVFRRIGKVKKFVIADLDSLEKEHYFYLRGNSNNVKFLVYGLETAINEYYVNMGISSKKVKEAVKGVERILRLEVRLDKPKAIHIYTEAVETIECMKVLLEERHNIFIDVVKQVIPFGDFYKKDNAMQIIQKEVGDRVLRRKMMRLVMLIPEKKCLYLAQKSMSCSRDMDKIMKGFAEINLSPVTLSKRQEVKCLKNIYSYIVGE